MTLDLGTYVKDSFKDSFDLVGTVFFCFLSWRGSWAAVCSYFCCADRSFVRLSRLSVSAGCGSFVRSFVCPGCSCLLDVVRSFVRSSRLFVSAGCGSFVRSVFQAVEVGSVGRAGPKSVSRSKNRKQTVEKA